MRSTRPLRLVVMALGLGAFSCGGGGDSGPGLLLAGSYHLVGLSASTDGTQEVEALWGSIEADGAGLLTLTALRNRNGTVDGPDTTAGIPYSVDADRIVRVLDAADPSVQTARGKVAPEGDVAVLGSSAHDREPGLWIAVRKGGTFDLTSLEGRYHGCLYVLDASAQNNQGIAGSWDFDGVGAFTCAAHENVDGVTGIFSTSGPYAVTSGGAVTLALPQGDFQGGMLAGGELAVLAGSTSNAEDPGLLVLIRATPIAESWDVQYGDHLAAGLERALIAGAYRSHVGTFTIANSTDISVAWSRNQEGTVTTVPAWNSSWAIDPDAAFGFYDPVGSFFVGGLQQAGRFAAAGGCRTAGGNPGIYFFVR